MVRNDPVCPEMSRTSPSQFWALCLDFYALHFVMFQSILSVLKEFVLLITYPKWLRLTGNEYVIDLRINARRTVPVSNIYLET